MHPTTAGRIPSRVQSRGFSATNQADIRFSDSLPELTQTWQHFGKVYFSQAFGVMQ